jgi:hypothetical protein
MINFKEYIHLLEEIDVDLHDLTPEELKKWKAHLTKIRAKHNNDDEQLKTPMQLYHDKLISDREHAENSNPNPKQKKRYKRKNQAGAAGAAGAAEAAEDAEEVEATPDDIDDEEASEDEINNEINKKNQPKQQPSSLKPLPKIDELSTDEQKIIKFFSNPANFKRIRETFNTSIQNFDSIKLPISLRNIFPNPTIFTKTVDTNPTDKIISALYDNKSKSNEDPKKIRENFINGLTDVMSVSTIFQSLSNITNNGRLTTKMNQYEAMIGKDLGEPEKKFLNKIFVKFSGTPEFKSLFKLPDVPFTADMLFDNYKTAIREKLESIVPTIPGEKSSDNELPKKYSSDEEYLKDHPNYGKPPSDNSSMQEKGEKSNFSPNDSNDTNNSGTDRRSGGSGRRSDDTSPDPDSPSYSTKNGDIPFTQDGYTNEIERLTQEALKKLTEKGYVKEESISIKKICDDIITEVAFGKFGGIGRALHNQIRPTEKGTDSQTIVNLIIQAKKKAQNIIDKQFKILDPNFMATRNQKLDAKYKIKKSINDLKATLSKINYKAFKATAPGELNLLVRAAGGTAKDIALAAPRAIAGSRLGKLAKEKWGVHKEISNERHEMKTAQDLRDLFAKEGFLKALEKNLDEGFKKAKQLNDKITPEEYINNKSSELNLKNLNLPGLGDFATVGDFERRFGDLGKQQLLTRLRILVKRESRKQNFEQKEKIKQQNYTVQDLNNAAEEVKNSTGNHNQSLAQQYANNPDELIKLLAKTKSTPGITKETYAKLFNKQNKNAQQPEFDFSNNQQPTLENYEKEFKNNKFNKAITDQKFNPNKDPKVQAELDNFSNQILAKAQQSVNQSQPPDQPETPKLTVASVTTGAIGTVFPHRVLSKEIKRRLKK